MLFSRVMISCFRAKAHLVFHWYLYNNYCYVSIRKPVQKIDRRFRETPTHRRTGGGGCSPSNFGQLRFFGQEEKFGQNQFLKKFHFLEEIDIFFILT